MAATGLHTQMSEVHKRNEVHVVKLLYLNGKKHSSTLTIHIYEFTIIITCMMLPRRYADAGKA